MKTKQQILKSYAINLAASMLIYAVLLYAMSSGSITRYLRGILMTIFINIILAASLNLTTGFLGQIALGHAGFMSIGAYSAALFVKYIESTGVVLLADGKRRKLAAPKRKNPKHLRPTRQSIDPGRVPTDRALRRALAGLRGEEPGEQEEPVAYPQAGPGVPDRP